MRHGQYRALIVRQTASGFVILAGNHTADALTDLIANPPTLDQLLEGIPARYRDEQEPAAKALLDQIERGVARCEILECTDADAIRVNVADNRISDIATDDPAALAELIASLDGDYDGTGYDPQDIDKLADSLADPEPPDEFPDYDDDIETEYTCPKCSYSWSGKPS